MSLKHKDLVNTVLPYITVDDFEPKAGSSKDVIVVAFYLEEEDPAKDLNTFIQRGNIDTLAVEVSLNTDKDGRYLVFVELDRNELFFSKFKALVKDVENVSGKMQWKIKTYISNNKEYNINDPILQSFIIVNPEEYKAFKRNALKENIERFLKTTSITHLDIYENVISIGTGRNCIMAEVVDVGDYDTVFSKNNLSNSAFNLTESRTEVKILTSILGVCNVMPIRDLLCVSNNDNVMLLKNTEIKLKG